MGRAPTGMLAGGSCTTDDRQGRRGIINRNSDRELIHSWGNGRSASAAPQTRVKRVSLIYHRPVAEALPILCVRYFRWERERERERRKWVRWKWRHHCRAKIGDEFTLSLAKNSHFSFLPSHFPSLPSQIERSILWRWNSQWVHTFHCAKKFFALFVPPLSNGTSRATSDRKPKTNDQILPSPIFFFPTKKWIKLIPKAIGNRKRDCAWGGSGW